MLGNLSVNEHIWIWNRIKRKCKGRKCARDVNELVFKLGKNPKRPGGMMEKKVARLTRCQINQLVHMLKDSFGQSLAELAKEDSSLEKDGKKGER